MLLFVLYLETANGFSLAEAIVPKCYSTILARGQFMPCLSKIYKISKMATSPFKASVLAMKMRDKASKCRLPSGSL